MAAEESAFDKATEEFTVVIVLDFEGTGLNSRKERITQIGARAYDFEKFKVTDPEDEESARLPGVEAFVTYVDPKIPIPPESTEITGIDNNTVKGAPTSRKALEAMYKWVADIKATQKYVLAYNGFGYDYPLLFAETLRANFNANAMFQNHFTGFIDPLLWGRHGKRLNKEGFVLNKTGTAPSLSQPDVYKSLFKDELSGAHDALVDITGLAKVSMHARYRLMWDGQNKYENWCRTIGTYLMQLCKAQNNYDKRVRKEMIDKVKSRNLFGAKREREEKTEEQKKEDDDGRNLSDLLTGEKAEPGPKKKKLRISKSSAIFFQS